MPREWGVSFQSGYSQPALEPAPRALSFQVVFPDAAGMDSGKEPSSAPEMPEKRPGHREASEEGPLELRTPEQSHLVDPG